MKLPSVKVLLFIVVLLYISKGAPKKKKRENWPNQVLYLYGEPKSGTTLLWRIYVQMIETMCTQYKFGQKFKPKLSKYYDCLLHPPSKHKVALEYYVVTRDGNGDGLRMRFSSAAKHGIPLVRSINDYPLLGCDHIARIEDSFPCYPRRNDSIELSTLLNDLYDVYSNNPIREINNCIKKCFDRNAIPLQFKKHDTKIYYTYIFRDPRDASVSVCLYQNLYQRKRFNKSLSNCVEFYYTRYIVWTKYREMLIYFDASYRKHTTLLCYEEMTSTTRDIVTNAYHKIRRSLGLGLNLEMKLDNVSSSLSESSSSFLHEDSNNNYKRIYNRTMILDVEKIIYKFSEKNLMPGTFIANQTIYRRDGGSNRHFTSYPQLNATLLELMNKTYRIFEDLRPSPCTLFRVAKGLF